MKATIDIPDDVYRRVKAKSALEGRPIREVTLALYEGWLAADGKAAYSASEKPRPSDHGDDKPAPRWFGLARRYVREGANHDMDAIRESISRGWAQETAEAEAALPKQTPRRKR